MRLRGIGTDDLRRRGYDVREIGERERMLPHAIVIRFALSSSGALVPVTTDSKADSDDRPACRHLQVKRYGFGMP